jgi:hypothetical protein
MTQPQESKMLAFVNTTVTKSEVMAQLQAHAAADEFTKGTYWNNGKGCAVGCTIHSGNHAEYEPRFGIPQMLARLEDTIFEGLPNDLSKVWPLQFIGSVQEGSDLSLVGWKFLHWILTDEGVNPGINHPVVANAIKKCADLIKLLVEGGIVKYSAASVAESAASAAYSAASAARSAASAESAAYSAARSAESAATAAYSTARSAARGAESAAYSAACAADNAARSAVYVKMSHKLLELIKSAPIGDRP